MSDLINARENGEWDMFDWIDEDRPDAGMSKRTEESTQNVPNDDLVFRKAAIDALMAAIDDVGILDGDDIKAVFDNLPSAQPDIVHCRECIHWRYDTDHTCRYYGGASPRLAIDFCSKGERREDG